MTAVNNNQLVITGISGRYPESDNIDEFWSNLMDGVQMCSSDDRRWPVGFMSLPTRTGKLKNVDKFDSDFFNICDSDANYMDPQIRLLHETTYEAIWDSGLDPNQLRGSKTAVFIGLCYSDTDTALKADDCNVINYLQCEASRLSYAFDFRGPAVVVDTACASMFTALNEGLAAFRNNVFDNLIVAGAAVHLRYMTAAAFKNLRMISDDGLSKCLDARADGYCRSEAVVSLFIQRKSVAKRIYASIITCKMNEDGYKQEGNHFPSIELQTNVMKDIVAECALNTDDINYIEAHVTGTTVGDPVECKAILNAYRENSKKQLLFGALKSNIGHTEGASGGCAITKVVLAFQRRSLPPNANFKIPNPNIDGLSSGVIVPVLKPMPFNDNIIPVNTFGFGGVNVHAILKANDKVMDAKSYRIVTNMPRIVAISGRTHEMIESTFSFLSNQRKNVSRDFLALLNDVSKIALKSGYNHRGFAILDDQSTLIKRYRDNCNREEIWFVFTEECETIRFGEDLLQIHVFDESLRKSTKIMKAFGVDLIQYRRKKHKKNTNEYKIRCTLTNTAIKLALIDVFKYLNIIPDGIIGHSMGEILAAFADNCITQQQALLTTLLIAKTKFSENEKQAKKLENVISRIAPLKNGANCNWISTKFNGNIKHCDSSYFMRVTSRGNTSKANEFLPLDANIITFSSSLSFTKLYDKFKIPQQTMTADKLTATKLLEVIGEIYLSGHNPAIEKLYPKVRYPVARETASLSPIFKWNHSKKFLVTKYPQYFNDSRSSQTVKIDLVDTKYTYLSGHCIDGRILFPAAGYLQLAWNHLIFMKQIDDYTVTPVVFKNVNFLRAIILPKDGVVSINVKVNSETGEFFIIENGSLCASGHVMITDEEEDMPKLDKEDNSDAVELDAKSIYKEFRIRGYDYGPSFQGLFKSMSDGSKAKVKWMGNWTSFIDSLFQLSILGEETRSLKVPTFLEYLRCDCKQLFRTLQLKSDQESCIDCTFFIDAKIGFTDGIIIRGMKATAVHRRQSNQIVCTERQHSAIKATVDSQSVKLAQQQFTAYKSFVNTTEKWKTMNEQYLNKCTHLLQKICYNEFDLNEEDEKDTFNNESIEEYALYTKLIRDINKKVNFDNFCTSFIDEEKVSFLFKSNYDQMIGCQLKQIIENMPQKCLNLIEFNQTANKLRDSIIEVVDSYLLRYDFKSLPEQKSDKQFIADVNNVDLIVYKDVSSELITNNMCLKTKEEISEFIKLCYNALTFGGFALFTFRKSLTCFEKLLLIQQGMQLPNLIDEISMKSIAIEANFKIIGERIDDLGFISYVFKKVEPLQVPFVIETSSEDYEWVEHLKQELKDDKNERRIWLTAKDGELNGVIGLTRCLKKEPSGHRIRCLVSKEVNIPSEVFEKDLIINVIKNDVHGVYIHNEISDVVKYTPHSYLNVKTRGDLSSFRWYEAPHKNWSSLSITERRNSSLVNVYFSALNFKDVMVSTGRIPLNAYPQKLDNFGCLGMEYSGIDENGNRVFGFCSTNGMATTLIAKSEDFCWSIPQQWTLEQAATIPVVYITVYYALFIRAELKPNETVLIHAGSGGVGQAAISVCLAMGCKVFASVGTEEKKQFLKSVFPQLKDCHFVNSRDLSFEEHILKETNGRGVDVILNSLAEEKLRASIYCLSDFGRFVEIGKYDITQNNPFDASLFQNNKTFHAVCVAHLMYETFNCKANYKLKRKLCELFENGLKSGEIKPLKRTVFDKDECEKAFRFMASGKHIGKVLLRMRNETMPLESISVKSIPQTFYYPSKVYIIIGGLGGFGLELAFWLSSRGAKKLVLTSRTGIKDNYQRYIINRIEKEGTTVRVIVNDSFTFEAAKKLVATCSKIGPIGGIFNLAMVLNDALVENQTSETFMKTCKPKIDTTLYLDQVTRSECLELDYFVCFSSAACGRGNAGQSNYGYANSFMETVCEKRRKDNLHGLAIQWGAIGDVGFVMDNFKLNDIVIAGTVPQRIPSCMKCLDLFLNCSYAVCSSAVFISNTASQSAMKGDLLKTVCHILGVSDASALDDNTTLADLGMDSLMAVEIKQGLEREYNTVMSTQDMRSLTVKQIKQLSEKKVITNKSNNSNNLVQYDSNPFKWPNELFVNLDNGNQGVPIFFLPPIEGDFTIMKPLVKYISRPVVAIQWTEEVNSKQTIEEAATYYVAKLRENYPQLEYEFVSYSFGSMVALEMCIQLQAIDARLVKKLIFLDSNFDEMKLKTSSFIEKLKVCTEKEAFEETITVFLSLFQPFEIVEKLKNEILSLNTKYEQIRKAVDFINTLSDFNCTPQSLTATMQIYLDKMRRVAVYQPSNKFNGTLHYIYSSTQTIIQSSNANSAKCDHSMKKYVDGSIQLIAKNGDHKSFLTLNYEDIGNFIETQYFSVHS